MGSVMGKVTFADGSPVNFPDASGVEVAGVNFDGVIVGLKSQGLKTIPQQVGSTLVIWQINMTQQMCAIPTVGENRLRPALGAQPSTGFPGPLKSLLVFGVGAGNPCRAHSVEVYR
jgi:hypothetical protein